MADIRRAGLLDDFNAEEDPLGASDGRWQILDFTYGTHLREHNGAVEVWTVTGGTAQSSYWTRDIFVGDTEIWGHGVGGHDLREGLRLYLHIQPQSTYYNHPWQVSGYIGYRWIWSANIGGSFVAIQRFDGDNIAHDLVSDPTDGESTGGINLFRKHEDTLEYWSTSDASGLTGWTLRLSCTDTTYNSGHVGLGTAQDDNNPAWGDVGAGSLNRNQIYRYVSN